MQRSGGCRDRWQETHRPGKQSMGFCLSGHYRPMKKPTQQLLGIAAPKRKHTSLVDRGYGTTETPQQRRMRLARALAVHEAQKHADAVHVLASVKLRRMP